MWIVNLFPLWVYSSLFFAGLVIFALTYVISIIPQRSLIQWASVGLILGSVWCLGARTNENSWTAKIAELEKKILIAEASSARANVELQTALAAKTKVITEKVYVNKEIIREVAGPQIDATCTLPISSIVLHDSAAQATVASGPGSVDGSPSGVAPSKLLETVVENYGSCQENAARLRAWQEWYKSQKKIYESVP